MLNKLLFASFLAFGCTASSVSAPAKPVQPVEATVVFAIEGKFKINMQQTGMPTSRFALLSNGSWTYVESVDGKVTKRGTGTIARGDVKRVEEALALATWKYTMAELRCMAEAITFTEYSSNGGVVWTDEMCDGKILDDVSQKSFDSVMAIVQPLIASSTTA